jgi:hypothetical protein
MRTRLPRSVLSTFALAAVALSAAGCGGGSSTAATGNVAASSPSAATGKNAQASGALSKPQLVAQADAVCKRLNTELARVQAKSETAQEALRVVPRNIALERRALAELNGLRPAPSLAKGWAQIIADRKVLVDELAKLLDDASKGDKAGIRKLAQSKQLAHTTLNQAAKAQGFKDCGVLGQSTPPR